MTARRRREVVTHPAIFTSYNRPYVIVSDTTHPDYPDQYLALGLTTREITDGVAIRASDWEVGGLSRESSIDPRYPVALSERGVVQTVGALDAEPVDEAVHKLARSIGAV